MKHNLQDTKITLHLSRVWRGFKKTVSIPFLMIGFYFFVGGVTLNELVFWALPASAPFLLIGIFGFIDLIQDVIKSSMKVRVVKILTILSLGASFFFSWNYYEYWHQWQNDLGRRQTYCIDYTYTEDCKPETKHHWIPGALLLGLGMVGLKKWMFGKK